MNTWDKLSGIDCSKFIEKKNGLSYLSWANAWGIVKKTFPDATYKVVSYDERPYLFDEHLGYLVSTEVTIQDETIPMHLPVMDYKNRSQRHVDYENRGKVSAATMFDVNTAIMRCLTKNLAMFGLGHYIYAGEDLPKSSKEEQNPPVKPNVIKSNEPTMWLNENDDTWKSIVKAIEEGKEVKLSYLEGKYKMTAKTKESLIKISVN